MIDSKVMKIFLTKALQELSGEWMVMGGTVLPLMGIDYRVTMDIDMINLSFENSTKDSVKLMQIAESMKMPVETINQAGAYFLSKITDHREHLVEVARSKKCCLYRPDAYLFVQLKIGRLSESDLEDCLVFMKNNKPEVKQHAKGLLKIIKVEFKKPMESEKKDRLKKILEFLER